VWRVRGITGSLQPFSRDKLLLSLFVSCQHRKTALEDAAGLTETIIAKLGEHAKDAVIGYRDIAQVAQVALNRFDKAASTHYQAFHS
jgi:transcriptional regulator NrdR family protein